MSKKVVYIKNDLRVGCGDITLMVGHNEDGSIHDSYFVNKGDACASNLNMIAILLSLGLKAGVTMEKYQEACRGVTKCPAFARARAKGDAVSTGSSCGTAILFALIESQKNFNK